MFPTAGGILLVYRGILPAGLDQPASSPRPAGYTSVYTRAPLSGGHACCPRVAGLSYPFDYKSFHRRIERTARPPASEIEGDLCIHRYVHIVDRDSSYDSDLFI